MGYIGEQEDQDEIILEPLDEPAGQPAGPVIPVPQREIVPA